MEQSTNYSLASRIRRCQKLTKYLRYTFFAKSSFEHIRDWFVTNSIRRNFPIEYDSIEVAIILPNGILLHKIKEHDNTFGLFGGIFKEKETMLVALIRNFNEQTGLSVTAEDFKFIEFSTNFHENQNGDQFFINSYRFVVQFDDFPSIKLGKKSDCLHLLSARTFEKDIWEVTNYQRDFLFYIFENYLR